MTEITLTFSDTALAAVAGKCRRPDATLSTEQKARKYLVDYCREIELQNRRTAAQIAVTKDETSVT